MTVSQIPNRDATMAVFDAMPSLVFIVDDDVGIRAYNAAAAELVGADRNTVLKRRAGDVLHCIHAMDVPEGCGRGRFCEDCVIRNSVTEAFQGNKAVRRRRRLELIREGTEIEIYALITVSPYQYRNRRFALLVLEDVSEIAEIRRMVPICSVCGKVKEDMGSWKGLEAYFRECWDVDFRQSVCPECYETGLARVSRYLGEGDTGGKDRQ